MIFALLTSVLAEEQMQVQSAAFGAGELLPVKHTCDGENVSPPLGWAAVPGARTYALIVDDPDAPGRTWVHWLAWNIDGVSLAEGATPPVQGLNDFKKAGWGGPCPPKGHGAHRYFFRVYALDRSLSLRPGATRAELEQAMEGHVIGKGELMGKYFRDGAK